MQSAFVSFSPLSASCHFGSNNRPSSFVSQTGSKLSRKAWTTTLKRRCQITPTPICQLPSHDEEQTATTTNATTDKATTEQQQQQQPLESTATTTSAFSRPELIEIDEQLSELDTIAESWIGSDIGRWEWYERLRCRRTKLLKDTEKKSATLDDELEQLRRTLLEFDAVLGTHTLDENHNISPIGWSLLFTSVTLYVAVGYAIVHTIVYTISSFMQVSSFP